MRSVEANVNEAMLTRVSRPGKAGPQFYAPPYAPALKWPELRLLGGTTLMATKFFVPEVYAHKLLRLSGLQNLINRFPSWTSSVRIRSPGFFSAGDGGCLLW